MMKKSTAVFILAALVFGCFVFFRPGAAHVRVPHESRVAAMAIAFFGPNATFSESLSAAVSILFGSRTMELPFAGNLPVLMQWPLFAVFGAGLTALRASYALCSLVSLFCLFYVFSRWFDEWVGALAALFLALDPVFIMATRFGAERDEVLQICLFLAGLALSELSVRRGKKLFFYIGALCFGIAFWAKLMFLGYLCGAVAAWLAVGAEGRRRMAARLDISAADIGCWLVFFCAGAMPFIIYNLSPATFMNSPATLFASLFESAAGRDNMDLLSNLGGRLIQFRLLAANSGVGWLIALMPFVCAALGILLFPGRRFDPVLVRAVLVLFAVCFVLTIFVPSISEPGQLLMVWPVVHICMALAFRLLWLAARDAAGRARRGIYGALCVFGVVLCLFSMCRASVAGVSDMLAGRVRPALHTADDSAVYYSIVPFLENRPESEVFCFPAVVHDSLFVAAPGGLRERIRAAADLADGDCSSSLLVASDPGCARYFNWGEASSGRRAMTEHFCERKLRPKLVYMIGDLGLPVRLYVYELRRGQDEKTQHSGLR